MTARIGAPKTGGRRKGSLDKNARQLVTAEMAGDLLTVYKRLGGVKWLLKFAEDNPKEFLQLGLSRLFPAAPKDDEPSGTYNQYNFNSQDTFEAARRVAFALNLGLHAQQELAPVAERVPDAPPEAYVNQWKPPIDAPDLPEPASVYPEVDPERAQWIEELGLTPEERADNALIRETKEVTLASYRGGPGEQSGPGPDRPAAGRKPTISEIRRRQLLS